MLNVSLLMPMLNDYIVSLLVMYGLETSLVVKAIKLQSIIGTRI